MDIFIEGYEFDEEDLRHACLKSIFSDPLDKLTYSIKVVENGSNSMVIIKTTIY